MEPSFLETKEFDLRGMKGLGYIKDFQIYQAG